MALVTGRLGNTFAESPLGERRMDFIDKALGARNRVSQADQAELGIPW